MAESLRGKATRGILVIAAMKVVGTAAGRLSAVILPLYLLPVDFGIFALAVFFSGIMNVVADLGTSTDLIRRKDGFEEAKETAFTMRLVVAIGFIAASPAIGWGASLLYGEPALQLPIIVLSLGLLLQAVTLVPRVLATRALDFPRAVIPDTTGKASGVFFSIGLAVIGLAYWSLVLGVVFGLALTAAIFLSISPWRPRFLYRGEVARDILRFGRFVTLASLANFAAHSLDDAFVGAFLGVSTLGLYVIAYSWGVYFTSSLASVVSHVTYPVLSLVSETPARMRRVFSENLRYYGYAAFCLTFGVLVFARVFVESFYGPVWAPSIVPMQLLAPVGLLLGYVAISSDVLYALGRSREVFVASLGEVLVAVALVPPATVLWGIEGTSVAVLVGILVVVARLGGLAVRATGLRREAVRAVVTLPVLGALAASAAGLAVTQVLGTTLVSLVVGVPAYLAVYVAAMQGLTRGGFLRDLTGTLRQSLRR